MPISTVDEVDETEAPESGEHQPDTADKATPRARERSRWARNAWTWVTAALVLLSGATATMGYWKYQATRLQLTSLQRHGAERAGAIKLAEDYALKSLTYSFQDPDAYFRGVEQGVSPSLKDKYVNAAKLLRAIMLQAQVTSTGEVLAKEAQEQPGDVYQVVVTASQTMRNLQNPEPRTSTLVLQVTVSKADGGWQVSDIGPRSRSVSRSSGPTPALPVPSPAQRPAGGNR